MPDARHLVEPLPEEALVACGSVHRDLDEIVVFAGGQVGLQHFRKVRQRLPELLDLVLVVTVEGDLDDDRVAETELRLVQHRHIVLDIAGILQPAEPCPAGAGRKADPLGLGCPVVRGMSLALIATRIVLFKTCLAGRFRAPGAAGPCADDAAKTPATGARACRPTTAVSARPEPPGRAAMRHRDVGKNCRILGWRRD